MAGTRGVLERGGSAVGSVNAREGLAGRGSDRPAQRARNTSQGVRRARWIQATDGCYTGLISCAWRKATTPHLSLPRRYTEPIAYRYPHESEREAMRGDWEKIGADRHVSIAKAERETAAD